MRAFAIAALLPSLLHAFPTPNEDSKLQSRQTTGGGPVHPTYGLSCSDATNGNNPFDNYWAPHDKKRSVDMSFSSPQPEDTALVTRDNPCNTIAFNKNIVNGAYPIGNSGQIMLIAGTTYVFAWAFDTWVTNVRAYLATGGGHFRRLWDRDFDGPGDSAQFTLDAAAGNQQPIHFEVQFGMNIFDEQHHTVNGQIGLFRVGPPPPTPPAPPPPGGGGDGGL
ncbi:MAG: hypothetical protein Q9220_003755 [cf. Caloplaca sp. 1 TL-2023]